MTQDNEVRVDENGVKYINLEPTPQGYADIFYRMIMDGEDQDTRNVGLIELLRYTREHPEVLIGPRRIAI